MDCLLLPPPLPSHRIAAPAGKRRDRRRLDGHLRVREQIHSNFLGQHVVNGSFDVNHVLGNSPGLFASHGAEVAPARALGSLSATVQREANTLAYIDGFWLTVWFAIAALALL
jgi:DHA2 family multidrug resistance protein